MDATLEQYIHLGLSILVATAVLVMVAACLHLRRDAQVDLANREFYRAQYDYKSRFNGLENGEVGVIETISIITQFADELDIYVDHLSGTFASRSLKVDSTNRYNIETLDLSDAILNEQFNWVMTNAATKAEAKKYGVISAATVGNAIYGADKWTLTIMYDNADVTAAPPADNGKSKSAKITGIRLIKK